VCGVLRTLAAVLVLALSAAPVAGCSGDDPDPLPVRITAFLKRDAAGQQAAVEARIRALPAVTSIVFVSRQEAYERFKTNFKDSPDLLASTKPESLPEYLEAVVTDGAIAEAVQLVIEAFDEVDQTTLALTGDGDITKREQIGVLVRLKSAVTDDERAAIQRLLQGLPRTEAVSYETPEQTKARLLGRCKDKGDLAASLERVPAHAIPASFRFRIGLHGGKAPQLANLQQLAGVESMLFVPVETV
jgi:cell division protein FtsX